MRRVASGMVFCAGDYAADAAGARAAWFGVSAAIASVVRTLGISSMSEPLISVLIDMYNYGGYVEQAIESVLEQNFPAGEREILVVDDGSTDDTQERVKKYGSAITYLKKANGG